MKFAALRPPSEEVRVMRRANALRSIISLPFFALAIIVSSAMAGRSFWLALVAFFACLLPVRLVFGVFARRLQLPVKPDWGEMIAPKDPLFWPISVLCAVVIGCGLIAWQLLGAPEMTIMRVVYFSAASVVVLAIVQCAIVLVGERQLADDTQVFSMDYRK